MKSETAMGIPLKICLALVCISSAAAGDVDWLAIIAEPTAWHDALGVANNRLAALVLDDPQITRLRGFMPAAPLVFATTENDLHAQLTGFLKTASPEVDLEITWHTKDGPAITDFKRAIQTRHGLVRSTYRIGETTITRTVLAAREDGMVLIHFLADKPGALTFHVTLSSKSPTHVHIEDQRQLVLTPYGDTASVASRAWLLPFESEVTNESGYLTVRGEGEALILWNFSPANSPADAPADTWLKLGKRYDPGHSPPSPTRIWQGILETQCKSAAISP